MPSLVVTIHSVRVVLLIEFPLSDYFTKILEDNLKAVVKPQYVDQIPRAVKGDVRSAGALIKGRATLDNFEHVMDVLGAYHVLYPYE